MLDIFTSKSLDEALTTISTEQFKLDFDSWINTLNKKTSVKVSFFYLCLLLLSDEYPIDMIEIHTPAHTFSRLTSLINLCSRALEALEKKGEVELFEYYYPRFVDLIQEYIKRCLHQKVISEYFADYMTGKTSKSLSKEESLRLLVADIQIMKEYKATFDQVEVADLQTLVDMVCVHYRLSLVDNLSVNSVKDVFDEVLKVQNDSVFTEYYRWIVASYYQNPACDDKTFIYLTLLCVEHFVPTYKVKLESYHLLNSSRLVKMIEPLKGNGDKEYYGKKFD